MNLAEQHSCSRYMQKPLPLLNGAPPPVDPDENLSSSEVPHEGSAAVEVAAADPEADPSSRVDSAAAAIPDGSGVGSVSVAVPRILVESTESETRPLFHLLAISRVSGIAVQ